MSLNCGSNAALDGIMGKVDEIKGKLAEGMSALSDLESKANEALADLQAALPEIPTGDSLQADLSALITQMQTDAGGAITAFKEKYGEALPEGEIQGYIDQLNAVISDPLSLASFDPCSAFPNKEIDTATNEVIVKAKEIEVPNVQPPKIVEYKPAEAPTTVKYESKITDNMKANTAARQKALDDQEAYFKPIRNAHKEKATEIKSRPLYGELNTKAKAAGKKRKQMKEEGLLTEAEVKIVDDIHEWLEGRKIIKARDGLMARQLFAYYLTLTGEMPQKVYDTEANTPGTYLQGGKNNAIPAGDIAKFNEISAEVAVTKAGAIEWKAYQDELASSSS